LITCKIINLFNNNNYIFKMWYYDDTWKCTFESLFSVNMSNNWMLHWVFVTKNFIFPSVIIVMSFFCVFFVLFDIGVCTSGKWYRYDIARIQRKIWICFLEIDYCVVAVSIPCCFPHMQKLFNVVLVYHLFYLWIICIMSVLIILNVISQSFSVSLA